MMHGLSRGTRRTMRRLRRKRAGELNIVSMIDILTVLVFFLLVNSIGVSILGVNLPDANSKPPPQPPRALAVVIRGDSLTVTDSGGPLKALPNLPTGYDLPGLSAVLQQVKERVPDESKITLLLEAGIPYDALVQVMDAARAVQNPDGRGERELFPLISLGDAPASAAPSSTPPAGASGRSGGTP